MTVASIFSALKLHKINFGGRIPDIEIREDLNEPGRLLARRGCAMSLCHNA